MPKDAKAAAQKKLIAALDQLPDEALGWLVQATATYIWPPALGGFRPDSRKAIEAVRKASQQYIRAVTST